MNDNVLKIIKKFDLIIINETHFGTRTRGPKDFILIGRSQPKGGVAIFKNRSCTGNIEMVYDGLHDCVICRVVNTDIIIVGLYILPHNSIYFNDSYFANMELIHNKFKSLHLYFFGDLNCRIGTPNHMSLKYVANTDKTFNTNGVRLLNYLKEKRDLIVINGCITEDKIFDCKFTFYRGNSCPPNDAQQMIWGWQMLYIPSTRLLLRKNSSTLTRRGSRGGIWGFIPPPLNFLEVKII